MNDVYLLTGGNIGDRVAHLTAARAALENTSGRVVEASALYETAAWGKQDQPNFLNQVLRMLTDLSPQTLLANVLRTEIEMGRTRGEEWGPRLIDIDILFYNDDVIDLPGLRIPHPRLHMRRFVLKPMCDLAPLKIHPVLKKTMAELLAGCEDDLAVNKFH